MVAYEWRVKQIGLTMANAESCLRHRNSIGTLVGVCYGWAVFLLPADAGHLSQLFAFLLVASLVTVLTLGYAVMPSYYQRLSALTLLPLAARYLYLLVLSEDTFYLLMLAILALWGGLILRKANANARWVTRALEANARLSDEINQRQRVEMALRQSDESSRNLASLLRMMCDNVQDMIWAKDKNNKYLFANAAMCNQLLQAQNTDEPVGHDDMFFALRERALHAEDPDWHSFGELCLGTDDVVLNSGQAGRFEEAGNIRGKYLCLDVYKASCINEQGKMIGTVGSARDITERKQAEQEVARYREKFGRAGQGKNARVARCQGSRRVGQPCQERFPGQYEP
jgi:PAS domain-containing protein